MIILICLLLAVFAVVWWAYITNPFATRTIIRLPYRVYIEDGQLKAHDNTKRLRVSQSWLIRWFAVAKSGLHIVATRYIKSPAATQTTVSGIIHDIHTLRYDPNKLLLISGDHFNSLFVRNLGIFYYPMLDTRIASKPQDWYNRQAVYAQTVAYALGVFAKNPIPTTTIVPVGPYQATCINFYAYPSDTVYGVFYALAALTGKELATPTKYATPKQPLQTKQLGQELVRDYQATMRALYDHYRKTAYDDTTGLVSTELHMSGAKDITRRQSSFFDNVIFWKTTQLAMQLAVIEEDKQYLRDLKTRIIKKFWLPDQGYFLEDLSKEGIAGTYYSSDWLIVLATGFLDPAKASERHYFEKSIAYIQANRIDQPFPIKYQADTRAHRQFLAVRIAVASYGGDAIWSFWGMEYIKTLMLLYQVTGRKQYLLQADSHIASYKKAMLRDKGYPEVYDNKGDLLQTPLYRSIRQTGWVIGFEQVLAIRKSIV